MVATPDKYQQAVISSPEKDIVILAGAGSGKTFTLLEKLHNLVSLQGVPPESILVLTFTKMAALEMRERYITRNKATYQNVPDFNTFHAFCYRVISENRNVMNRLGYVIVPRISNEYETKELMNEARNISRCKLSLKKLENPQLLSSKELLEYESYTNALKRLFRKNNSICFDDLSEQVCNLFSSNDPSVELLKKRYRYIFVDEFQDTDETQFKFIMSMENSNRLLCGDALQNIYQFRGCNNEPLKQLTKDVNWKTYELPTNYRSTSNICDYSNTLSSNFISKDWRIELIPSKLDENYDINEYNHLNYSEGWNNPFEDGYLNNVSDEIIRLNNIGGSTAVLCRTNSEVSSICKDLSEKGIRFRTPAQTKYDLELIDEINSSIDNLNFYSMESQYEGSENKSYSTKFMMDINTIQEVLKNGLNNPETFIQLQQIFGIDIEDDIEFTSENELLSHIANRIQNNTSTYIGTIHSVKGLEFDNVIVVNVGNDKFFKLDTEENQNLLYVACTRAKKNLSVFKSLDWKEYFTM